MPICTYSNDSLTFTYTIDDELCKACSNATLEEVKRCISLGANAGCHYELPIRNASKRGHLEIVKYLISIGSDMRYAFRTASKYGHVHIINYLIPIMNDEDIFYYASNIAINRGHLAIVELLVANGTKIKGISLRNASCNGHLNIIKYVVQNEELVNHCEIEFALLNAIGVGYLDIVKYLVSRGVSVSYNDNRCVCIASLLNNMDIIKYLVANGADITVNDHYPLRIASKKGWIDIVKYLISIGADFTALNNWSLKKALKYNHIEVAKYLISIGAYTKNISSKNRIKLINIFYEECRFDLAIKLNNDFENADSHIKQSLTKIYANQLNFIERLKSFEKDIIIYTE